MLFLIILLMTPEMTAQKERVSHFKKILTEDKIEEVIVKYIINNDPIQQSQQRLVYHFKQGYFYLLDSYNLPCLASDEQLRNEEEYFMEKINEYLPDFLRVQPYVIEDMVDAYKGIPVYGAIITNKRKDRFLFVQDSRTGKYGFCKGKIAERQTPQECVIREVREETDYRISNIGKETYQLFVRTNNYTFFEAEIEDENPQLEGSIFEGKDHRKEIKRFVWWSRYQVERVLQSKQTKIRFNYPTKTVMKQYLSKA